VQVLGIALSKTHNRVVDLAASLAGARAAVAAASSEVARLGEAVGLEAEAACKRAQEAEKSAQETQEVKEALHARAAQEQEVRQWGNTTGTTAVLSTGAL
jgi:hypothetical protein